jgi:hypothetical protein
MQEQDLRKPPWHKRNHKYDYIPSSYSLVNNCLQKCFPGLPNFEHCPLMPPHRINGFQKLFGCMRYEVLTAVKMTVFFFSVMKPCRLISRRWRQYVSPKHWHLPTSLWPHNPEKQNRHLSLYIAYFTQSTSSVDKNDPNSCILSKDLMTPYKISGY